MESRNNISFPGIGIEIPDIISVRAFFHNSHNEEFHRETLNHRDSRKEIPIQTQ